MLWSWQHLSKEELNNKAAAIDCDQWYLSEQAEIVYMVLRHTEGQYFLVSERTVPPTSETLNLLSRNRRGAQICDWTALTAL